VFGPKITAWQQPQLPCAITEFTIRCTADWCSAHRSVRETDGCPAIYSCSCIDFSRFCDVTLRLAVSCLRNTDTGGYCADRQNAGGIVAILASADDSNRRQNSVASSNWYIFYKVTRVSTVTKAALTVTSGYCL